MKNKKIAIAFMAIVIIVAILLGVYKTMTSYTFNKNDGKIEDANENLIERLKNTEDTEKREKQVQLFLESGDITEQEAKEILEK